jgi:circadian clock protein KaiC
MPLTPLATTGIVGLDDILRGGLPRKRIYLVQGAPGSGKTTLGMQFLLEGRRLGETGLYVTLSETEEELRAVAGSHGWSLDGLVVHPLSSWEEMLGQKAQNTLFHPAEVELNETVTQVMQVVDRVQPARIVFDSLSEMRLLAGDSLRYRRQILALKQQFAGRNSTVLFLDDGTSESGDLQLQSIAHGVVALEKLDPAYGATRRRTEVVKLRGVDFRTGWHDYTIEKDGLHVFPRLVAAEHRQTFERGTLPSGLASLDALLGGGVERGTSTLLLGPAGTGKSTMITQYAMAAVRRKEKVAVFTFDENEGIFFARAAGMGMPLAEAVDEGLLEVRQVDPTELSPGEFAHLVCRAVDHFGARMVVIDSLNGYLMSMPNEKHLLAQMHEMLSFLAQRGVATFLVVAQHGMVGSMVTPVDLTYLADTAVLFRFFEAEGRVRKAISVLKKRIGRHEDTIRELRVGERGVEVGEPLVQFSGVLTGTPSFSGRNQALLAGAK